MTPSLPLEHLLAEAEDLLRSMPPRSTIRQDTDDNFAWLGRAAALVAAWSPAKAIAFDQLLSQMRVPAAAIAGQAVGGVVTMLHQVRHDLRLRTVGPLSVAISHGSVFDYFDELRKALEEAKTDLLFVDPYLDAEFVSRYLPNVAPGVTVRLLTGAAKVSTLLPSVQLMRQQTSASIEVRLSHALHDRFVFVDRVTCLQSGASFKDGAKKAPTTLTQITDAFAAMLSTYEDLWQKGQVQP